MHMSADRLDHELLPKQHLSRTWRLEPHRAVIFLDQADLKEKGGNIFFHPLDQAIIVFKPGMRKRLTASDLVGGIATSISTTFWKRKRKRKRVEAAKNPAASASLVRTHLKTGFFFALTGNCGVGIYRNNGKKLHIPDVFIGIFRDLADLDVCFYVSFRGIFVSYRVEYLGKLNLMNEIAETQDARLFSIVFSLLGDYFICEPV